MTRKKVPQNSIVSEKCFRLLRLKHEFQSDAKVLKAVVDEVDVLRLCRSLGMTVSTEGATTSSHPFDFGHFNPSDYDADFARFIREKLIVGSGNDEQLAIGCLFGKQLEVKAELTRMGFWSSGCEEGLSLDDQGVYCIEIDAKDHRQLVAFAWLEDSLFEKKTIRDTPAYVLRFLISLSSSVTCCLSPDDFRRIKDEVDAASESPSMRWNSCSVAFRVQKQVEQSDSISCGEVTRASIPKIKRSKSVVFVGGAFPAIAIESSASSTTDWVTRNDVMSYTDLADWLLKKDKESAVQLPDRPLGPYVRDDLLMKFGQYPDEELLKSRSDFDEQLEQAKRRIEHEATQNAKSMYDDTVRDGSMLFAVECPANSTRMENAFARYRNFLQDVQNRGIPVNDNYLEYKMLHLPERIQTHMKMLDNTFQRHRMAFDDVLGAIVRGDPFNPDDSYRRWLMGIMHDTARNVFGWFGVWRSNPEFSNGFRSVMENHHQRILHSVWINAINQVISLIQTTEMEQRVQQSTKDRETQFGLGIETIRDAAFYRFREHLNKAGEGQLQIKINRMMINNDGTTINIDWKEEVEKEPSKVVRMHQLNGSSPLQVTSLGSVEFEPGFQLLQMATVKMNLAIAVIVKGN